MRKQSIMGLILGLSIMLVGCGQATSTSDVDVTLSDNTVEANTTSQNVVEDKTETVEQPTEKSNYYTDLLDKDRTNKEAEKEKQASDLELARLMLTECTKKLSNCTVTIVAVSDYNCNDNDRQSNAAEQPTKGEYRVATKLKYSSRANQFICRQEKSLYRDITELSRENIDLVAQATAQDDWSDSMDFLLYTAVNDATPAVLKDEMTKGELYKYIAKDVRSSLNRFLAISIDDVEETDTQYIISGTTKEMFVIVDEVGGNAILNNETWVNAQSKQSRAGLMATQGILTQHNNNVVLYIDKETETLVALEATAESSLNNEQTLMKCSITDIGTTDVEAVEVADDLATFSLTDVPQINRNTTYKK